MLRAVLREPGLIEDPPTMVLGSLRLHGDPAFVRSTEELLRVLPLSSWCWCQWRRLLQCSSSCSGSAQCIGPE